MNRQKKILKENQCSACDKQMTTIHIQAGHRLCNECYDIIRIDTHEEAQALKDRKPVFMMFNEDKARTVIERVIQRYAITGRRLVFDRDILDSETNEYIIKELIERVFNDLDKKVLFG